MTNHQLIHSVGTGLRKVLGPIGRMAKKAYGLLAQLGSVDVRKEANRRQAAKMLQPLPLHQQYREALDPVRSSAKQNSARRQDATLATRKRVA